MSNYRKIWEAAYGSIPYDSTGRKMEIHHIDGNRKNNNLENLKLVTIEEHYKIHESQCDWAACQNIILRMSISPEVKSIECSNLAKKRVVDGAHHFKNPDFIKKDSKRKKLRVKEKNSMWGKNHSNETKKAMSDSHHKKVKEGTHHTKTIDFANQCRDFQNTLVQMGNHNFQKEENRKNLLSVQFNKVKNGTHPLQSGNRIDPNMIKVCCLHCKKETSFPSLMGKHKHK